MSFVFSLGSFTGNSLYLSYSYLIMFKCWYMDPNKRPTFSELTSLMSQNLASLAGYLDVCAFSELKAHAREDSNSDAEVKDKM